LALQGLRTGDSFDIVLFAGDTTYFDSGLVPVSPDAIEQAHRYLGTIQLRPSTNIDLALTTALAMPDVNVVVLITDGVPTSGETDFKKLARNVRNANRYHARIDTVGLIGRNPDGTDNSFEATQLLQQIAKDSGGQFRTATVGVATPD